MVDAGASVYAAVGVAYVIKCYIIMSPKKIKSLYVEMDSAQSQYMNAATVIPANIGVAICMTHDALTNDLKKLPKSRWGHWKNRAAYNTAKKRVKVHCDHVFSTSRACLNAAYLASAQERLAKETAEIKAGSAQPECRYIAREDAGDARTSDTIQTPPSGSSDSSGVTSSPIPSNLSSASLPLQYPVMVPSREATQPSSLLSELEGLILDGNLIDFSGPSADLGQREAILIDLSSEDADALTIYRLSLDESNSRQTSDLLNSTLVAPNAANVVTGAPPLPGKAIVTGTPDSVHPSTQLSVPTEIPNAGESVGRFASAAATVRMISNVASAFSAIAGDIMDS
ncbi:uncharacterized protein EV420DRAFT_1038112 [Desarmillaria tabescens]|uniref:Uncharacterized protein n=1 Tax=Armillaria tabescens TaxID=1929756 RepID=A0AA39NEX3_ARMTA|nr:uncharacterized protein EV420DRAFT_1038112 [Desarmillaria tabescens]KAK0464361.1 hypothetical protein EV420DRAFT_1038112 [Desarmillaria tabescens]